MEGLGRGGTLPRAKATPQQLARSYDAASLQAELETLKRLKANLAARSALRAGRGRVTEERLGRHLREAQVRPTARPSRPCLGAINETSLCNSQRFLSLLPPPSLPLWPMA